MEEIKIETDDIEEVKVVNVVLYWLDEEGNHVEFVLFPNDIHLSFDNITEEWTVMEGYTLKRMIPKFSYIGIKEKHPTLEALIQHDVIPNCAYLTINYNNDTSEEIWLKGGFVGKIETDNHLFLSWGNAEIGLEQYIKNALNEWRNANNEQ